MNAAEINGFVKSYGATRAVDELSIDVPSGSFFGLIGPNGAGKSTTVHFLAGVLNADNGERQLFGDRIEPHCFEYKRRLGLVLENPFYIERLTGLEYLRFVGRMYDLPDRIADERSVELLQLLDLLAKKDKWIENYSFGMKKKISIAAALIHDPDLLILDEPFEGVDAVSARLIAETLQRMVERHKTVFLASHRLEWVYRLCDRVTIIDRGRAVFSGDRQAMHGVRNETDFERFYLQRISVSLHADDLSWNRANEPKEKH